MTRKEKKVALQKMRKVAKDIYVVPSATKEEQEYLVDMNTGFL